MADNFLPGLENFRDSLSLADINSNLEFINHFPMINRILKQPSASNVHSNLVGFPVDNFLPCLPELPSQDFPGLFHTAISHNHNDHLNKMRKAMELGNPANSSPEGSDNGIAKKNDLVGRGRKVKHEVKKAAKPTEVVHVRAKRGQATDSHSIAERVRREKINERLRCLQNIVPGCNKTMGMAVMLDEIINYVQSLQNQVEFLSMKLTAASTFYDFNSESDTLETMQRTKAYEALKIQNEVSSAQFVPLGPNFKYCPHYPHSR